MGHAVILSVTRLLPKILNEGRVELNPYFSDIENHWSETPIYLELRNIMKKIYYIFILKKSARKIVHYKKRIKVTKQSSRDRN